VQRTLFASSLLILLAGCNAGAAEDQRKLTAQRAVYAASNTPELVYITDDFLSPTGAYCGVLHKTHNRREPLRFIVVDRNVTIGPSETAWQRSCGDPA
jgi:hypothetical protein